MTDEFKFNIGDTAVAKILELREQEPGEKGELNIEPKNVHTIEETPLALENFLSRKNIGKTVISF